MKKVNIPLGASALKVSVIDKEKLSEKINKVVGKEINVVPDYYGLLITENNHYLIDKECCGVKEEHTNFLYQDCMPKIVSAITFNVPFRTKPETKIVDGKKRTTISIIPTHEFTIDVDFLTDCIIEEIPLYLFMGERYDYNGRIQNNMWNILKDVGVSDYTDVTIDVDDWKN
jgi:hypothetical protein